MSIPTSNFDRFGPSNLDTGRNLWQKFKELKLPKSRRQRELSSRVRSSHPLVVLDLPNDACPSVMPSPSQQSRSRRRKRRYKKRSRLSSVKSPPRSHFFPSWMGIAPLTFLSTPMQIRRYPWNGVTVMQRRSRMPRRCSCEASAPTTTAWALWSATDWRIKLSELLYDSI